MQNVLILKNYPIFPHWFLFNIKKYNVLKIFSKLNLFLILFLLGFYIFQIGEITKSTFLNKSYQQEIEGIQAENLGLEAKTINVASFSKIEAKSEELNFVKVSDIKYIPITSDYLVKKDNDLRVLTK